MNTNPKFSWENWGPVFFISRYLLFRLKVKRERPEDKAYEGHPAPTTPVVFVTSVISREVSKSPCGWVGVLR